MLPVGILTSTISWQGLPSRQLVGARRVLAREAIGTLLPGSIFGANGLLPAGRSPFGPVPGRGRSYGKSERRRRGVVGDAPESTAPII